MLALGEALTALDRSGTDLLADGWVSPRASAEAIAGNAKSVVVRALERQTGPDERLDDLAGGARFGPWPPRQWLLAFDGTALRCVRSSGGAALRAHVTGVRVVASERAWQKPGGSRWTAELEVDVTTGDDAESASAPEAKTKTKSATKTKIETGAESESGAWTDAITADPSEQPAPRRPKSAPPSNRSFVLGFGVAESEAGARASLAGYAREIARAAAIDVEIAAADEAADDGPLESVSSTAWLGWGLEGELVVLRDHASTGPTSAAGAYRTTAIILGVVAVGLWVSLGFAVRAGSLGPMLGTGAVALVVSIATYAFFEIARFAGKYDADSLPLAWFGDDRVVVTPWVSRYGAVDTRPHGQLGAAIRCAEIHGCKTFAKDGVFAVELSTEHGPIEITRAESSSVAEKTAAAVERAIASVAAPEKKKTALMRAKARRQASA